jgi:hypothetical protein
MASGNLCMQLHQVTSVNKRPLLSNLQADKESNDSLIDFSLRDDFYLILL